MKKDGPDELRTVPDFFSLLELVFFQLRSGAGCAGDALLSDGPRSRGHNAFFNCQLSNHRKVCRNSSVENHADNVFLLVRNTFDVVLALRENKIFSSLRFRLTEDFFYITLLNNNAVFQNCNAVADTFYYTHLMSDDDNCNSKTFIDVADKLKN